MRSIKTITFFILILAFLFATVSADSPPISIKTLDEIILKDGITLSIDLSEYYSEPDGENITYVISREGNVTIDISGDEMLVTPHKDFIGLTTIRLKISDTNNTISDDINFYVLNSNPTTTTTNTTNSTTNSTETNVTVNTAPKVTPNQNSSLVITKGDPATFSVTASDNESDTLTYSWSLDGNNTPGTTNKLELNDLEPGTHTITLETTDGKLTTRTSWSVTVEKKSSFNIAYVVGAVLAIIIVVLVVTFFLKKRARENQFYDSSN